MTALRRSARRAGDIAGLLIQACFALSCLSLVVILLITIYEISMRYFLDSPTIWVSDSVRYLLAFMIMLGLPDVTRRNEHVSISLFVDRLRGDHPVRRVLFFVSACVCFFVTWLALDVSLVQFDRNLYTQGTWRIPRVFVTGPVVVGFFMAGLTFLGLSLRPKTVDED